MFTAINQATRRRGYPPYDPQLTVRRHGRTFLAPCSTAYRRIESSSEAAGHPCPATSLREAAQRRPTCRLAPSRGSTRGPRRGWAQANRTLLWPLALRCGACHLLVERPSRSDSPREEGRTRAVPGRLVGEESERVRKLFGAPVRLSACRPWREGVVEGRELWRGCHCRRCAKAAPRQLFPERAPRPT